jgi:hypothetical protein
MVIAGIGRSATENGSPLVSLQRAGTLKRRVCGAGFSAPAHEYRPSNILLTELARLSVQSPVAAKDEDATRLRRLADEMVQALRPQMEERAREHAQNFPVVVAAASPPDDDDEP